MKTIFAHYEYIHKSSKKENSASILAALPSFLLTSMCQSLQSFIY